jgi:hypothetical protein
VRINLVLRNEWAKIRHMYGIPSGFCFTLDMWSTVSSFVLLGDVTSFYSEQCTTFNIPT